MINTQRAIRVVAVLLIGVQSLASGQLPTQNDRPAPSVSDTLRLADALVLAKEANPSLQAARLRADAAAARVSQMGALPDLQVNLGLMNRRVSDFGGSEDPMTKNTIGLAQRLPWPGQLGFGEDRAEHLALAERLDADEAEQRLLARLKSVYYRLAYMDRAILIMSGTRELLRDFLQVSSAMYSVGTALQQDVLQAQVSVAQMTEDITVMEQDRLAMAARLNALLGRGPTVAVGALELPPPGDALPDVEGLMELAVQGRPALRAARERVQAAEAGYRAAQRGNYPDFTVMVEYSQRPNYPDLATVMVGLSFPLWSGSRDAPDEMQAVRSMEEAREQDLYNETFAGLAELRAQVERARNLSALYSTSILPQARAAVESALSAYRVGRVEYMTLLGNEMTVNRYQIERVRLTAEYHRAVAQVEAIIGNQLEGVR